MAQALEFDDVAGGGKGEPRGCFVFIVEHFGEEHLGAGGEAAAGHLLGIAHQFIEVNFWCGDKGSDAAAALDDGGLNSLVGRQAVAVLRWHSLSRIGPGPFRACLGGSRFHDKNDIQERYSILILRQEPKARSVDSQTYRVIEWNLQGAIVHQFIYLYKALKRT